jgi:hypothetical protein
VPVSSCSETETSRQPLRRQYQSRAAFAPGQLEAMPLKEIRGRILGPVPAPATYRYGSSDASRGPSRAISFVCSNHLPARGLSGSTAEDC